MQENQGINWTFQIWRHLLLFIFLFLTSRIFYEKVSDGLPIFGFVTNMGIMSITLILCGLYLKITHEFTAKYLVFAGFGLAWTIFAIRFTFPVVSEFNWFEIVFKKNYDIHPSVGRFGDFLIHVLPLLTYYAILYFHGKKLKQYVNSHPLWIKLLMAYSPYFIICIWTIFHNPYNTYMVPENTATWSILYIGIPILLLLTSSRPIFLQHTPTQIRITYIVQACGLFVGIMLGVHIFGLQNLQNSVVSYTCTILLMYLLFRIFKGNQHRYCGYWFLPVFGLVLGQVFCRELYFIITGESHAHFIQMARVGLENASYWYSLYLVLTFVFLFSTTSTLLASEFPKDITMPSPVRDHVIASRKACKTQFGKFLHETWHSLGGVMLIGIFMLLNFNDRYDLGIGPKYMSDGIFMVIFILLGYGFPGILYRKNVKKLSD